MKDELKKPILLIMRTAWDHDLREKFLADPRGMLIAAGLPLAETDKLHVHQDKPGEYNIVLPVFSGNPLDGLNKDHPLLP